jgi:hypothetical protein
VGCVLCVAAGDAEALGMEGIQVEPSSVQTAVMLETLTSQTATSTARDVWPTSIHTTVCAERDVPRAARPPPGRQAWRGARARTCPQETNRSRARAGWSRTACRRAPVKGITAVWIEVGYTARAVLVAVCEVPSITYQC